MLSIHYRFSSLTSNLSLSITLDTPIKNKNNIISIPIAVVHSNPKLTGQPDNKIQKSWGSNKKTNIIIQNLKGFIPKYSRNPIRILNFRYIYWHIINTALEIPIARIMKDGVATTLSIGINTY